MNREECAHPQRVASSQSEGLLVQAENEIHMEHVLAQMHATIAELEAEHASLKAENAKLRETVRDAEELALSVAEQVLCAD